MLEILSFGLNRLIVDRWILSSLFFNRVSNFKCCFRLSFSFVLLSAEISESFCIAACDYFALTSDFFALQFHSSASKVTGSQNLRRFCFVGVFACCDILFTWWFFREKVVDRQLSRDVLSDTNLALFNVSVCSQTEANSFSMRTHVRIL